MLPAVPLQSMAPITKLLQLPQPPMQHTMRSSCSVDCSVIAACRVFGRCQAGSTRTKTAGRGRCLKPEESRPRTRLRLRGRVQVRFSASFVGRLEGEDRPKSRPAARPRALPGVWTRAENTAGPSELVVAARLAVGERHRRFPGARAGLQYEFTRPAVAGPPDKTPTGSDRLGRNARAAETPHTDSFPAPTRTL